MGDIMEQTVSGAAATGTHGTGRDSASIAAQITALELVTADGSVLTCSAEENPDVFAAARLGLGALGVVSELTFAVEPEFLLTAREEPMAFDEVTAEFDELVAENEHFEFYWFPHTGSCNTKRNNRSQGPAAPPGKVSGWVEDELLSNGVFQLVCTARPGGAGRHTGHRQDLQPRPVGPYVHRHPVQGVHLAAAGAVPGDGVRTAPRGRGGGAG